MRREGAEPQSDHGVADRDGRHLRACLEDAAAHLSAQQPLLDEAERPEHVPEVEPRRLDRDANLPGLQRTRRQRLDMGSVEHAGRVRSQHPVRLLRQGQALRPGAGPNQAGHLAASRSIGDVVLGIGIEEFLDQIGCGRRLAWVQIDHPRLEMSRFTGRGLAETPQRCAGKFPAALPLQHLCASRDQPDAMGGDRIGVGDALHQRQRTRSGSFHVLRHFLGSGLCPVTVQSNQVDDAAERQVAGQTGHKRPPGLPLIHFHGGPEDTRTDRCRPLFFRRFTAG